MYLAIDDVVKLPDFDYEWKLPKMRKDIKPRCLTDLLETIPDFQKFLLPNSRSAITQINRVLRKQSFIPPTEFTKNKNLYSSIALAVDRGSLHLYGVNISDKPVRFLQKSGEKKLSIIIEKFSRFAKKKNFNQETAAWLYLIGRLDPIMRGFRPISDIKIKSLPKKMTKQTIKYWLKNLIPKTVSDEIIRILESLKKILPVGSIYPNPVFGGIGPIMGSDGDWICDDMLVELKCTINGVNRKHVTQIICYSALSEIKPTSKKIPKIKKLGILLPRQSSLIVGSINDWLLSFGAPTKEIVYPAIEKYFKSYIM